MAGGVAPKTVPLIVTALAKMRNAEVALQALSQSGLSPLDATIPTADAAVTAAVTALQALQ